MNEKLEKMRNGKGFIAALDQSGGSTPKALKLYGINENEYSNDKEMFDLIHKMRTRIIKSPAFNESKILGAILFEQTMDSKIDGKYTADFLWEEKKILPFLKIDKGLNDLDADGVQTMKPNPTLPELLKRANERHIFGTKMRSVIKKASPAGIARVVEQQFEIANQVVAAGLIPIIEPEVDINNVDKVQCEEILRDEIRKHLNALPETNAGTLEAAILISAPVCGLRPVRALRSLILNVPKPINCTASPFFKLSVIASKVASKATLACFLFNSAALAIASIKSVLFID